MGVIVSRHGSGTYIPAGPPILGSEPLRFLAALHGFSREEMYEVRRVLEVSAAGLAAERASAEHTAAIAEEVASLFASIDDPQAFLVHDIRFHQAVAAASGNPILGALVEMVSALYYERRRETATRATDRNLRDAADLHRSIYQAIRTHDADRARTIMNEHLLHSAAFQAEEEQPEPPPAAPAKEARKRRTRTASTDLAAPTPLVHDDLRPPGARITGTGTSMANPRIRARLAASIVMAAMALSLSVAVAQQPPPSGVAATRIDVVAVDKDGRPVDGLHRPISRSLLTASRGQSCRSAASAAARARRRTPRAA